MGGVLASLGHTIAEVLFEWSLRVNAPENIYEKCCSIPDPHFDIHPGNNQLYIHSAMLHSQQTWTPDRPSLDTLSFEDEKDWKTSDIFIV